MGDDHSREQEPKGNLCNGYEETVVCQKRPVVSDTVPYVSEGGV